MVNYSSDLDAGHVPRKAMTMATRGMSLATKATIDPIALVAMAKENCK